MRREPSIPLHARAVLAALQLDSPAPDLLGQLNDSEWRQALAYADRARLTLPLGLVARECLPGWVCEEIDRRFTQNAERWRRTRETYLEVACAFERAGLEFAVLKGFAHCPRFARMPNERWQGDIDLLLTESQARPAFEIARALGYQPIVPDDAHPLNHLPTLVRRGEWEWKGDVFDVEMPLALELHFRLWDEETEQFNPVGWQRFWERRERVELDGLVFGTLHPADAAAYSALHLLRHLLHGNLRASHVYELAWMLHHASDDARFWESWAELHEPSLRRIETICFVLAEKWFDCRMPPVVSEEVAALPDDIARWLDTFSCSPLENEFRPNKDELWLHWALLDSARSRAVVLRRRLVPAQLPSRDRTCDAQERTAYFRRVARRAVHHARALIPTARSGLRFFSGALAFTPNFWRFLFAEAFFDFGMFIFVFLYNLYLVRLGYREDFLGRIAGLMMAGSVAGSLGAAYLMERWGTVRVLAGSFALTAGISAVRATAVSPARLLGLAGMAGLLSSVWPVALAPLVASVTTENNRRAGFSLVCSSGIAIGILGNLAAGHLPGWLFAVHWAATPVQGYRFAMLTGCAFVVLAIAPLAGLKSQAAAPRPARRFRKPRPVVLRFLLAMAAWNLGTGLFNSFTSVFFARHVHLPLERIGYVFACGQIAQVGAVLAAPLVFRKFGLRRSIAGMELATAIALFALAQVTGPLPAAIGYCFYMMAQYMSEPGMFTLLMDSSAEADRTAASAMNLLVMFGGQAAGARIGGHVAELFGYPALLTIAAVICCGAAILFGVLLRGRREETQSVPVFAAGRV